MKRAALLLGTLLSVTTVAVYANNAMQHKPGMDHSMMMGSGGMPSEVGQSAFAAIQEIVLKLEEDQKTDWTKINIEGLRQHLIDMNNVTIGSEVNSKPSPSGLTFTIAGEGKVKDSIQRMIKAHANMMNGVDGWAYSAIMTSQGAELTVTAPNPSQLPKLQALGFIGLMTSGMHHQEHHWMLANGIDPHQ